MKNAFFLGILGHYYEHIRNLYYAYLSFQKLLSGIIKSSLMASFYYALWKIVSSFHVFFYHWLLFVIMNMVSRIDTFMNSDLLFLLYSKPYTQYFVQNFLTSICKLKNISVYLQILNCVIKDNIAWDHYIEQLQERLCYLSSQPVAEALCWALLCGFMWVL